MPRNRNARPAPVSSVLQSPKDSPLEFFQENGRPLSARMSDKPGGAFSGLRPNSFTRPKAARSRVTSIEEESLTDAFAAAAIGGVGGGGAGGVGIQSLVSETYSGFGRSGSSIGAERPISTRRIVGSTSGDIQGVRARSRVDRKSQRRRSRGRSGAKGAFGSNAGGNQVFGSGAGSQGFNSGAGIRVDVDVSGGEKLPASSPPSKGERNAILVENQKGSVGTALHAIDHAQSLAPTRRNGNSSKIFEPVAAAAVATHAVATATVAEAAGGGISGVSRDGVKVLARRASAPDAGAAAAAAASVSMGPNGNGEGEPSVFEQRLQQRQQHGRRASALPKVTSTGTLVGKMASMNFDDDSVVTIGTPMATPTAASAAARPLVGVGVGIGKGFMRAARPRPGHLGGITNGGVAGGVPIVTRKAPKNIREAIDAGDVLAVASILRAMTPDAAEVELVEQDSEQGTPLMQAAAGKNVQIYKAVMDAIRNRLGVETLMNELQTRDLRAWCPLMHAAWSGSADVFRGVVTAIEENLGRDQVAEQLAATAKYGWTPLHAAARGNAEAMGAVMTSLVHYMEADELKEQLSQSHDKDSDLPTPLMFAAASSSLDSRSLSPLLSELLGCMCDIDESRRQRTAVDYAAAYGRLDTLSCLIAYGCEISDQTVTTLLSGDLAVGAAAFNRCIWKGITTARNPLIPAHNVLRAVGRAADRDAKHRQFLLRMQSDVDELVDELLQQLPPNMAGFAVNHMDTGEGFAAMQWLLEPELAGKRTQTFTGPLARALETRRLEFFSSNIVLAYVSRKFSRGLPGVFSGASWKMPDMHKRDTKRFVLGLPYGAAPDNIVGAVRMRLLVPFELIQGSAFRRTSLIPGLQFNAVGLASRPDAFYEVPAVRMAFDVITYLSMLILFCLVVKLDSPSEIPARERAFYAYMLGNMVNELGEARYVRNLRGQSELWNVVEAILLALICAAFTARMIAFFSDVVQEEAFFLAQLFFAIATPLFFSRVLFLAQIDENVGLMVQILFRMLKQVVRFGVVIGIVLLGFAMAMYALFGGSAPAFEEPEIPSVTTDQNPGEEVSTTGNLGIRYLEQDSTLDPSTFLISEVYLPSFSTFSETALTMFRAMLLDFDFDEFSGVKYGPAGVGLMVAFLVVMVLTLLNLLIAFLSGAHAQVQKQAKAKFHFTRTQIVQHWDRVVEHDVLPAPLNLVHLTLCLVLKACVSKKRYPAVKMRIGCFLFWIVMGPLGAAIAIAMWLISLPWSIWHLCFGGQAGKEVDRKLERLKYVFTAPGLVLIALFLGFLTIFVGDGSSDGGSGAGRQPSRNARTKKVQRGGDYDLAGLLKKLANIGVDDLRRQLKNPLKHTQVLPRDAKMGTTVEHVKQLRDDITTTTSVNLRETLADVAQLAEDRAVRIEARMAALEGNLAKVVSMLEHQGQGGGRSGGVRERATMAAAPVVSASRSTNSSHVSVE